MTLEYFTPDGETLGEAPVPLLTTDRQGLEVISYEECKALLQREEIGRVAFVDAGEPVILPVNFVFIAGSVLFRTTNGSKLDAATMERPLSFEIDGWDTQETTGWSVLVKGVSDVVTDTWLTDLYDYLGEDPWADAVDRPTWVRIRADEVSGRRIVRTPHRSTHARR